MNSIWLNPTNMAQNAGKIDRIQSQVKAFSVVPHLSKYFYYIMSRNVQDDFLIYQRDYLDIDFVQLTPLNRATG